MKFLLYKRVILIAFTNVAAYNYEDEQGCKKIKNKMITGEFMCSAGSGKKHDGAPWVGDSDPGTAS